MRLGRRLTGDRRGLYLVLALLFAVALVHRVRDTILRGNFSPTNATAEKR